VKHRYSSLRLFASDETSIRRENREEAISHRSFVAEGMPIFNHQSSIDNFMQLHTLKSTFRRPAKRVGRGNASGKGTTAGRGTKGQRSRGRGKVPAQFEGGQTSFIQKLPKNKGFRRAQKIIAVPISLDHLSVLEDGSIVTLALLKEKGLIGRSERAAKVLATGTLTKRLTIELPASASAKAAIEKVGGNVQVNNGEKGSSAQ
jgi:large subunit ribosomal protein L15